MRAAAREADMEISREVIERLEAGLINAPMNLKAVDLAVTYVGNWLWDMVHSGEMEQGALAKLSIVACKSPQSRSLSISVIATATAYPSRPNRCPDCNNGLRYGKSNRVVECGGCGWSMHIYCMYAG